jgi:hypothetical protein
MSKKFRTLLIGMFAILALSAVAGNATAAITTGGGSFTATTTGLQTLRTTIFGLPSSITCLQTLVFQVLAGTYAAGALPVGYVRSANFGCNNGDTVTSLITVTNTPLAGATSWQIGLNTTSASSILATALNVTIQAHSASTNVTCLFTGSIGFSVLNGVTTNGGTLLQSSMAVTSGICGAGTVTSTSYNVNPAFTWSGS